AGIFWTLGRGGTLVLPETRSQYDPAELARTIQSRRVSHLVCLPSLFDSVLKYGALGNLHSLRTVIVGGEPCPRELVNRHYELLPQVAFFNEYGPTEATVWSTVAGGACCDDAAQVPIGRPIANTQIYILDRRGEPVPIGVAGEIHIAGAGVA